MKGSGVWEIDALTAAWAVMSGINPERGPDRLRDRPRHPGEGEDDPPGLAAAPRGHQAVPRPEQRVSRGGARERDVLPRRPVAGRRGADPGRAVPARGQAPTRPGGTSRRPTGSGSRSRRSRTRSPGEIETYGGQPNKQAADMVTTFDPGRMIWNGYTGAAGWMFRQALEGVLGTAAGRRRDRRPGRPGAGGRAELDPRLARRRPEPAARSPRRAAPRAVEPNRRPTHADDRCERRPMRTDPSGEAARPSGLDAVSRALARLLAAFLLVAAATSTRAEAGSTGAARPGSGSRPSRAEHRHARALLANAMRYARPGEQDGRPGLGLSVRGLEPGPEAGPLPPLVHPADGDRPVHGAARRTSPPARATRPYLSRDAGPRRTGPPGQEPAPGPARPAARARRACSGTSSTWPPASGSARWPPTSRSTSSSTRSARRRARRSGRPSQAKGWIVPAERRPRGRRSSEPPTYGWDHFDGPLAPFARRRHEAEDHGHPRPARRHGRLRRQRQPLGLGREDDRRPAAARRSRTGPRSRELRRELEQFLDAQREGYAQLYDAEGRPVLLRLGRHQGPPFRLGRPGGEVGHGPRRLPGQRVPRPGHVRRRPVRPAHRRDQEPGLQDEAVPDAATAATSTSWPPGRARRSRPWGSSCR